MKRALKSAARAFARLSGLKALLHLHRVRVVVQRWPGAKWVYGEGWWLLHPFDCAHGTDTSGYVPPEQLANSPLSMSWRHVYGASQPSVVRAALKALPELRNFSFVDLGCGKGRPVMVAAEFPFKAVIGVELTAALAATARQNLAILEASGTAVAPTSIIEGDAATYAFPRGDLVIFLYNPFGRDIVNRVIGNIQAALAQEGRSIFVIYYNPVYGECFDACPQLQRYYASTVPYAAEERGFGPDETEPVITWQAGGHCAATPGADAPIRIIQPDHRVELAR